MRRAVLCLTGAVLGWVLLSVFAAGATMLLAQAGIGFSSSAGGLLGLAGILAGGWTGWRAAGKR